MPSDDFTEEEMQKAWMQYAGGLKAKGKKILSSSLQSDTPKLLNKTTIGITVANHTMKTEIERDETPLLDFVKEKLNNYDIKLEIAVNEAVIEKFYFTPQENSKKLAEKNPALNLLKRTFDLDL